MDIPSPARTNVAVVPHTACPATRALALVRSRWSARVLAALRDGPRRNGQLMRTLAGVSQKVLTQTLRELQAQSLVARVEHDGRVRHVEYGLTERGRGLSEALESVDRWAMQALPRRPGA